MSIVELNNLFSQATAALDAGNYDLAIQKAMAIQVRLATTPNVTRSLAGGGSQALSFNPAQLDSFISGCRQMKAAATHRTVGPFQQCKIVYCRPEAVDSVFANGGY